MSIKPWTAPGSPDLPAYRDAGTPATGSGSRTPLRMIRSFPVRSVTSIPPSGRNAKLQGYVSPFVTATTRILWPSAVSNSIGNFGRGRSARPVGATGMLFRNGTCCCTSARSTATYAAIFIYKSSLEQTTNHRDTKTQRKAAIAQFLLRPFSVSLCLCGSLITFHSRFRSSLVPHHRVPQIGKPAEPNLVSSIRRIAAGLWSDNPSYLYRASSTVPDSAPIRNSLDYTTDSELPLLLQR